MRFQEGLNHSSATAVRLPVSIGLHRSLLLLFLLVLIHILAAACIALLPWSWFVRSIFLVCIGISAVCFLRPAKVLGLRL
ncbi:MAG: hypothetical protein J0653_01245, partial [Deltaproteobacteria bacterium]|nr:hypothetical protein [Deltaproteobacteria bacterium]